MQEVFYLAYHLHWSRAEIMQLELAERRRFVGMVAEQIEAENKAREDLYGRGRR